MNSVELLKVQADLAYQELLQAFEGVTPHEAWAVPALGDEEFLYTGGSILEIVLHVASCKVMYGSVAFENRSLRWRDVVDHWTEIGSDWSAAVKYLQESQVQWLKSWHELSAGELTEERDLNWGGTWPSWKIISVINHHDSYHAGQINLIRAMGLRSQVPPPDLIPGLKAALADSPSW